MPTRRFSGGIDPAGPATTSSETTTQPASGCSKPAITRSSVVLPQPDGPSTAISSPRSISRFSSAHGLDRAERLRQPAYPHVAHTAATSGSSTHAEAAGDASTSPAP